MKVNYNFLKIKNKDFKRGFTLMELVVAVGIFSAVSVIAVGALLRAQTINTKMQQTHIMLDGMNLSMEAITRDIRYGRQFHCASLSGTDLILNLTTDIVDYQKRKNCKYTTSDANTGGNTIVLGGNGANALTNDRTIYYLYNGKIMKWEGDSNGTSTPITSDDVEIQSLKFFVSGSESVDGLENISGAGEAVNEQPIITIIIAGVTKPQKVNVQKVYFKLQTTVTPRELDY